MDEYVDADDNEVNFGGGWGGGIILFDVYNMIVVILDSKVKAVHTRPVEHKRLGQQHCSFCETHFNEQLA